MANDLRHCVLRRLTPPFVFLLFGTSCPRQRSVGLEGAGGPVGFEPVAGKRGVILASCSSASGLVAAAALARLIARAVWRLRWRWRAVTSPVTRVTRAARHACVRVRRHRASRASSPFPFPPCRTGTRALLRRRRLLARARGGGGGGVGGGVQLHRASRASRARACTSSPRIACVITVPLPPRAHTRALRRRRRSLAR